MSKWVIDLDGLNKARKVLKIEHPVKIKLWHNSGWAGEYRSNPLHCLMIDSSLPNHWEASETIWHELAHALQCERDYNGDGEAFNASWYDSYTRLMDADGKPNVVVGTTYDEWLQDYFSIPCEAEAEAIAHRYYDRIPLARSTA